MNIEKIKSNQELYQYLSDLLGPQCDNFLSSEAEARCLRINGLKCGPAEFIKHLCPYKPKLEKLPFSETGFMIRKEPHPLSASIPFLRGEFAFQGASSQIPPLALNPQPGERVLDMAASPGSKSTQMGALMQNRGQLILNDVNRGRLQALQANTQKSGMVNQAVYYLPGERLGRLFPEYFDKVLLDTPCSGLGTLAGHDEIAGWWSRSKLNHLQKIQTQLLISAIKATKPGGEIVYSTCSIAPEENEQIIGQALKNYPLEVLPINVGKDYFSPGNTGYNGRTFDDQLLETRRIWPHLQKMEGFFIARLRKTDSYFNRHDAAVDQRADMLSANHPKVKDILVSISDSWGIEPAFWETYRFYRTRNRIWMTASENNRFCAEGFMSAGLLLAEKRLFIWKLSTQALQLIDGGVTKRRISLDQDVLHELLTTGYCTLNMEIGYYALAYAGTLLGVLFVKEDRARFRLPHPFTLVP